MGKGKYLSYMLWGCCWWQGGEEPLVEFIFGSSGEFEVCVAPLTWVRCAARKELALEFIEFLRVKRMWWSIRENVKWVWQTGVYFCCFASSVCLFTRGRDISHNKRSGWEKVRLVPTQESVPYYIPYISDGKPENFDPCNKQRLDRLWKSSIDSAYFGIHQMMVEWEKEYAQVRTENLANREAMRESLSYRVGGELGYGEMEGIELAAGKLVSMISRTEGSLSPSKLP